MAVINSVDVKCTNKLCDYEGRVSVVNDRHLTEKHTCPKCGFKTLDEAYKSGLSGVLAHALKQAGV
jgi:hypothetical protein